MASVASRGVSANSTATIMVFQLFPDSLMQPHISPGDVHGTPWIKKLSARQAPFSGHNVVDIEDMITEIRSTPRGEDAWQSARRAREAGLHDAVRVGKMSKVKYYRFLRGLTQKRLAQLVGTKQSNISRYERPSYKPGRSTLEKLANALQVEEADLL